MVVAAPDDDYYVLPNPDPDPNHSPSNSLVVSTSIPKLDIPDNSTLKYELIPYTGPSIGPDQYYRVKALKSFGVVGVNYVKKGSIGGIVSGPNNLSQEGNCWIANNARVLGTSRVIDNARVYNRAIVKNSNISERARIYGNARVENSDITDNARIYDNAVVINSDYIGGRVNIHDNAYVNTEGYIGGYVDIGGDAVINENINLFNEDISITGNIAYDIASRVNALYSYNYIPDNMLALSLANLNISINEPLKTSGNYAFYKIVKSTSDPNKFTSIISPRFIYTIGESSSVLYYDKNMRKLCAEGLHIFGGINSCEDAYSKLEWAQSGDTILLVLVHISDIIAMDENEDKLRVRKLIPITTFL